MDKEVLLKEINLINNTLEYSVQLLGKKNMRKKIMDILTIIVFIIALILIFFEIKIPLSAKIFPLTLTGFGIIDSYNNAKVINSIEILIKKIIKNRDSKLEFIKKIDKISNKDNSFVIERKTKVINNVEKINLNTVYENREFSTKSMIKVKR